jgi:RNA polymerase sigma factor (sigma-70 family)
MPKSRTGGVLGRLQCVIASEQVNATEDAQLLERFAGSGDETAFELLVWRHRRLVMGVCRRVLGDYHDAEDAFQATFLTLARKASSISQRQCLAAWLYRVSYRIALNARRRKRPAQADLLTIPSPDDAQRETDRHDLRVFLDDEVSRLPAAYQAAIVLCYLQGKTYREASTELNLPLGTVSAHLSRARAMLRDALAQRGMVVSTATLASVLCNRAAVEARFAALVEHTVRVVLAGPQGCSQANVLSQGVLKAMAIAKLKTISVVSIAIVLVVAAFGAVAYHIAPAADRQQVETAGLPAGEPANHADGTKQEVQRPKPPTLADRFRALVAAWKDDCVQRQLQSDAAKTDAERKAIKQVDSEGWAGKMWALVEEAPNDPVVLEILCTIAVYHCWTEVGPRAIDRLQRDHVKDPRLGSFCNEFTKSPDASAEKFLRAVMAKHPDPAVKARAALALAYHVRWHVLQPHDRSREEEVRLLKEVEGICRDTIAKYTVEEWEAFPTTLEEMYHPAKTTMGKEARRVLESLDQIDIRRLDVNQPAPETYFDNIYGKVLKLSEFRGKVVLLSFGKGGCAADMVEYERGLVKRMGNRPFVIIGIDALGPDPRQDYEDSRRDWLKQYVRRELITWNLCGSWSAKSGNLFEAWNIKGCPTLCLIDDRGVIRQRIDDNFEELVLDKAIDGLVQEAETRSGSQKSK